MAEFWRQNRPIRIPVVPRGKWNKILLLSVFYIWANQLIVMAVEEWELLNKIVKKMSCLSFLHFRHWHCSGSYHSQKCMYFYQHIAKVVKNYAQKSNHFLSFSHYTICWWLLFSSKISFLITISFHSALPCR